MSFEYTVDDVATDDGKDTESITFTLKDINKLPVGVLRRNRRNQEAQLFATIEWGVDPDQLDDLDRLDPVQFYTLIEAWRASGDEDQDKPSPSRRPKVKASAKGDDSE